MAEFLAGRPAGSYRAPIEMIGKSAYCAAGATGDPLAGAAWNGWGIDPQNSRIADRGRGRDSRRPTSRSSS